MRRFLTSSRRRADCHAAGPPQLRAEPAARWTSRAYPLAALLALCACGPAAPVEIGIDFSERDAVSVNPEASAEDMPAPGDLGGFESAGPTPLCAAEFTPCGGRLAGLWTNEETCNGETHNPKALQLWGQNVMGLDTTACWDAVQSVSSAFMGEIVFDGGAAIDRRLRRDTVTMTLSRSCLNATFNVTIKPDKIASICRTLTNDMTSCTPVSGACQCTSHRENELNTSKTYAVLGTRVIVGPPGDDRQYFDYCVSGNQLTWQEAGTLRHVVLRRIGEATDQVDPVFEEDPR